MPESYQNVILHSLTNLKDSAWILVIETLWEFTKHKVIVNANKDKTMLCDKFNYLLLLKSLEKSLPIFK